jgi:hypothetical protein
MGSFAIYHFDEMDFLVRLKAAFIVMYPKGIFPSFFDGSIFCSVFSD